eukprot:8912509-Pyramimonas_sp.AAC.1
MATPRGGFCGPKNQRIDTECVITSDLLETIKPYGGGFGGNSWEPPIPSCPLLRIDAGRR